MPATIPFDSIEPLTIIRLWHKFKDECRGLGPIMADVRAGKIEGVKPDATGRCYIVTDEPAALAAIKKKAGK